MPKSALLTKQMCHQACSLLVPSLGMCMAHGPFNREAGFLVVLDPTRLYEPKFHDESMKRRTQGDFVDEVVLWSETFGVPAEWEHPFHTVALAKAYATFKYRLPAHVIVQEAPYDLEPGFTKYGGSAIDPVGGLIVAFSGVQAYFDRMISEWMVSALRALSVRALEPMLVNNEVKFLPSRPEGETSPGTGFDEADEAYMETRN